MSLVPAQLWFRISCKLSSWICNPLPLFYLLHVFQCLITLMESQLVAPFKEHSAPENSPAQLKWGSEANSGMKKLFLLWVIRRCCSTIQLCFFFFFLGGGTWPSALNSWAVKFEEESITSPILKLWVSSFVRFDENIPVAATSELLLQC